MKRTRRWLLRRCAVLFGAVLAGGCSPLKIFDTFVPKDSGVELGARDAAFGADPRQRIDVYRPRRASSARLPIIIFIYGGSWNSGSKSGYGFIGKALASRGYVVAIPDYRLVPDVRYPRFLEDNAAATRWVIANARSFGGDARRIVLIGHSAGAYDAAMLALDPRWLGNDRSRIRGLVGLAGPYDFLPLDSRLLHQTFGGTSDLASTQPVNHVERGDPPVFLATGDEDRVVRPRNSDALAARLRSVGAEVELKVYPAIGHVGLLTAFAKPFRGRASVLDDTVKFADRVTRPT